MPTNLFEKSTMIRTLGIALAAFCLSCSGDDSDGGLDGTGCVNNFNWINDVSDEAAALATAGAAYGQNQTAANCTAYQDAALEYLNALEDALDCVSGAERSELEASIAEARTDVEQGLCD